MVERVEQILCRKVKTLRFKEHEHAERIQYAALHRFYPQTHRVGRVVVGWDHKQLEQLIPVKRRSKVIWYFVHGEFAGHDKEGKPFDHYYRSKSFPATSPEEAERKARRWLKNFEKRLKKKNQYIYDASLAYANRDRGLFAFPGTNSSLLKDGELL